MRVILDPGTKLSNRYSITKCIASNDERLTYSALDNNSGKRVKIVEYYPYYLPGRDSGSNEIRVDSENRTEFETGLATFVDEAKRLSAEGGNEKLYDCINENGTAYMILEYSEVKRNVESPSPAKKQNQKPIKIKVKRQIPLWIKIVIPTVAVLAIVSVLIFVIIDFDKPRAEESIIVENAESIVVETEESDAELIIDTLVMIYDGHSYACFNNCNTWEEAEEYCRSLGGHLAVITSQEENEAIWTVAWINCYDNAFIGLSDANHEGEWQWVTEEPVQFTCWNSGEPNGFTADENYAVFSGLPGGLWNDSPFAPAIENGPMNFICEWDYIVEGTNVVDYSELVGMSPCR